MLTAAQQAVISFESGANPDLTASEPSFDTYIGMPGIVTTQSQLQTGAVVTYTFEPDSFTSSQQADIEQAMAVWSGVCNVSFRYVAAYNATEDGTSTTASLTFIGNDGSGEYEQSDGFAATGQAGVYRSDREGVYLDEGGNYGTLGDYATGGYGQSSVLHEIGHALGLGHTGPYNGGSTASVDAAQLNAYDNRAWSVMSYINPDDTKAAYYAGSPVPTANYAGYPGTVPMGLDIYAVQRLYGAPVSAMFGGGQIFGFGSNITYTTPGGAAAPVAMFDFAVNTKPVVTLYDYGAGNTLDLAGFTSNDTINLNPGSFSSAGGYTDNIFIEYGTAIDTLVAGSGNDVITVNSQADDIIGGAGHDTVVFADAAAMYNLTRQSDVVDVTGLGVTDVLDGVTTLQFADRREAAMDIACFADDTMILSADGPAPVQALTVGDLLVTSSGVLRPIIWRGRRSIDCRRHPNPAAVWPVEIAAGALGPGLPERALRLSMDHAVLLAGALVPVRLLVNGVSIRQVAVATVTYHHIELAAHDMIFANAAACESYLDCGNRWQFAGGGITALHADFTAPVWDAARACAPLITGGAALAARRRVIHENLLRHGYAIETAAPCQLFADLAPLPYADEIALPPGIRALHLISPAAAPAEADPESEDRRCLGLAVQEVRLDGVMLRLDDPRLAGGFYPAEGDAAWRWTDGHAVILPQGAARLALRLQGVRRWRQKDLAGDLNLGNKALRRTS